MKRSIRCKACDADRVSLLYWLILLRSVEGGLKSLDDGINGAQHYKLQCGSQHLCIEMAKKQHIIFNEILQSVNYQSKDHIQLTFQSGLELKCRRVILGFSPTLLPTITFEPSLPSRWNLCPMTMAKSIKTILIYSNSFWKNLKANFIDTQVPCSNIFESTNPNALIGLIVGEQAAFWSEQTKDKLIESICQQYSRLYQSDDKPNETFVQYWTKEHLSQGCYAAVYAPSDVRFWIDKNQSLVEQRIWLSSTEMALEWIGYIEGAIEAGQRFAQQVLQSFTPFSTSLTCLSSHR